METLDFGDLFGESCFEIDRVHESRDLCLLQGEEVRLSVGGGGMNHARSILCRDFIHRNDAKRTVRAFIFEMGEGGLVADAEQLGT